MADGDHNNTNSDQCCLEVFPNDHSININPSGTSSTPDTDFFSPLANLPPSYGKESNTYIDAFAKS